MKMSVQSADLEAILAAACAISKSPDPIQIIAERIGESLSEVGADSEERPVEPGQIRVIAYNETIVSEWRRPAEVRMTGSVAVLPEGIDRLVRASKGSEASFTLATEETNNERCLRMSTSRSAHEFPSVSEVIFDTVIPGHTEGKRADLTNLAKAIDTAKVAAASRGDAVGAKIALTGVHLRKRDGKLDVVGTDGKRLALTTMHEDMLGAIDLGEEGRGITLPSESLALCITMLAAGPARFEVAGNNILIENGHGSISVRMIDTPYPAYENLLGIKTRSRISLQQSALDIALQRSSVSLANDKRTVAVKLSRGDDGIFLTAAAAGQSSSECISERPGEEAEIGFDARYMTSAISVFKKADVDLDFTDTSVPIVIRSQSRPEVVMLVMPCKVG